MERYNEVTRSDVILPHKNTVEKLISDTIKLKDDLLDTLKEFKELKSYLISFYNTQLHMLENKDYVLQNYVIHDVLYQSLRQLLFELVAVLDQKQQLDYLDRVYQWFTRRKAALTERIAIQTPVETQRAQSPFSGTKKRKGKRTHHVGTKSPSRRLNELHRKSIQLKIDKQRKESITSPIAKLVIVEPPEGPFSPANLRVSFHVIKVPFRLKIAQVLEDFP